MAKDTYYFSHDYNARNDPKIRKLISVQGITGYGVYWAIIEDLYQNANALPLDCDLIAYDLRVDVNVVESVINDFDLFIIEDNEFGSNAVERRIIERNEKSISARKSAFKRWNKKEHDANALPSHCDSNALKKRKEKERKEKERKEKENKEKENKEKILENVFDEFRKAYPGTKRGLDTELGNLKKKHDDWQLIIPILENALKMQYFAKEQNRAGGNFVPEWKNLQTYINQRAWEEEIIIQQPKQKQNNGNQSLADKRREADRLLDEMYSKQR